MEDRFTRQADLVPRESLLRQGVTVVGVGAVGRQVALQLAAMGVSRMWLYDPDVVEEVNITTQGYRRMDLGLPKVEAAAGAIREIDPEISLELRPQRWQKSDGCLEVVFSCVDSIESRKFLWDGTRRQCELWVDGRMLGENLRTLAAVTGEDQEYYATTLDGDVVRGRCTARATLYAASILAGRMVHQLPRWLRGLPVDRDLFDDLLAGTLSRLDVSESA
jgi:molybdopterin-synthase adenylyltransferase